MTTCVVLASGQIELYFYGELGEPERGRVEAHLAACRACRELLDELGVIRGALSSLPDVSAPPSGDWSGFMARLDATVQRDVPPTIVGPVPGRHADPEVGPPSKRRPYAGYLAMAALLALITMSVVATLRDRQKAAPLQTSQVAAGSARESVPPGTDAPAADAGDHRGLAALTEQHFERSKLVVLGLATKDAQHASPADWTYERELASSLLDDTRLYRRAAEEHGMDTVAGVMRDLELVLLQTSMTKTPDPATLAQIQRLIRKRDLVTKMNVLSTTGL